MRIFLGIVLGFFLATTVSSFGDRISSPPPLDESLAIVQHYLEEIYVNFHRLQVLTTNPDGSRYGKKGDMVLLQTGGSSYLEINSDSSTAWLGVELTDTP